MSKANHAATLAEEKTVSEIKSFISEAEEVLSATADQIGDKAVKLRERVKAGLQDAKARLIEAEAALRDKAKAAGRATDEFVHDSPWTAVGIAAGVGVLVGVILSRR